MPVVMGIQVTKMLLIYDSLASLHLHQPEKYHIMPVLYKFMKYVKICYDYYITYVKMSCMIASILEPHSPLHDRCLGEYVGVCDGTSGDRCAYIPWFIAILIGAGTGTWSLKVK